MPGYARVAVVTGANKGIGYAIVRNIALRYPASPLNSGPLLVYLTARHAERGKAALQSLEQDPELKKTRALVADGGLTEIAFHDLDITSSSSISDFASFLQTEHPLGIDTLVNNAGILTQSHNLDAVKKTMACNYFGTLETSRVLLPLLKQDATGTSKVVNISSTMGNLDRFGSALQSRFRHSQSVEDVTDLMWDFTSAVGRGDENERGWLSHAYSVSKAGVTLMTRALALEEQAKDSSILVNSCCPGLVRTDMMKFVSRTPDQGARTPVMLALSDLGHKTGSFWVNEKEVDV